MPAGATWQGVYVSKTKGELDVVLSDRRADGSWRTPDGIHGSLWGAVDGNTLHYMWSEQRTNERGEPIDWFGRGYFVYRVDGPTHTITGEWGLDENETGNAWTAVKRIGEKPKLGGGAERDDGPDSDTQGGSTCYDCQQEESPE
jgi:hypothetical protein